MMLKVINGIGFEYISTKWVSTDASGISDDAQKNKRIEAPVVKVWKNEKQTSSSSNLRTDGKEMGVRCMD